MHCKPYIQIFGLCSLFFLSGCAGFLQEEFNFIPPEEAKKRLRGVNSVCIIANFTNDIIDKNGTPRFGIPEVLSDVEQEFEKAGFSVRTVKTYNNEAKVTVETMDGMEHPSGTFVRKTRLFEKIGSEHQECTSSVIVLFDANIPVSKEEFEKWKETKELSLMPYARCAMVLMAQDKRVSIPFIPGWDPDWDRRDKVATFLGSPIMMPSLLRQYSESQLQEHFVEEVGKNFRRRAIPMFPAATDFLVKELIKFTRQDAD